MKTIAYLRVSTTNQDVDQQRLAIWDYAQQHKMMIDEFVSFNSSPWGNKGFNNGPWGNKGFRNDSWGNNTPWNNSNFGNSPWGNNSPWNNNSWRNSPWANYGYNKPIPTTADTATK